MIMSVLMRKSLCLKGLRAPPPRLRHELLIGKSDPPCSESKFSYPHTPSSPHFHQIPKILPIHRGPFSSENQQIFSLQKISKFLGLFKVMLDIWRFGRACDWSL